MKKTNRSKCFAGLFAACILIFAAGAGFCGEVKANLTKLTGTVEMRAFDTEEWKAAAEGTKVDAGASVRCGADSSAFLNWSGNTVKVHPLSTVKVGALIADPVTGLQQSELNLLDGKTFARAKKLTTKESSFTIKTPSAIAGVRGTDFGVSFSVESQTTSVAVLSDSVVVEAGGVEMVVSESMATMVEMGAPPIEPTPIPPMMLQEFQADVEEVGEVEAAVEEAAAEEEAGEEAEAEEEAAEEETDMGSIVEDTTIGTLEDQTNQDIADQPENLFQECCQPR
ncbi:MAG: FecR family protein [bacterium]